MRSALFSALLTLGLSSEAPPAYATEELRSYVRVPQSCAGNNRQQCERDLRSRLAGLADYARKNTWTREVPMLDKARAGAERCPLTLTWLKRNITAMLDVAVYIDTHYPDRKKNRRAQFNYDAIKKVLPELRQRLGDDPASLETCGWVLRSIHALALRQIEPMLVEEIDEMIAMISARIGRDPDAERIARLYLSMMQDAVETRR